MPGMGEHGGTAQPGLPSRTGAGDGRPVEHGLSGLADAGAFLARLIRFDPAAVVRLRSGGAHTAGGGPCRTVLWARLPWAVLVGRVVAGAGPGDATVSAAELLAELGRGGASLPPRRDTEWRWPVPGSPGTVAETIAGAELRRIAAAAAETLRGAANEGVGGRAVGQRALRDALLDHVAVVVTGQSAGAMMDDPATTDGRVEVPQRLVQAIVRMGFLGSPGSAPYDAVQVRTAGRWVGLAAPFGVAWSQRVSQLAVKPVRDHPNG